MTDHRMSSTYYDSLNMIVNDDYEQIKENNNERFENESQLKRQWFNRTDHLKWRTKNA